MNLFIHMPTHKHKLQTYPLGLYFRQTGVEFGYAVTTLICNFICYNYNMELLYDEEHPVKRCWQVAGKKFATNMHISGLQWVFKKMT